MVVAGFGWIGCQGIRNSIARPSLEDWEVDQLISFEDTFRVTPQPPG